MAGKVSSLEVNTDTLHRPQEMENKTQHKMLDEFFRLLT